MEVTMHDRKTRWFVLAGALLLGGLLAEAGGCGPLKASATFEVQCYDVGATALAGRPGVLAVHKGFEAFREVDRVTYDPREVTVQQMEEWLEEAGTYVRTLGQARPRRPQEQRR
jgi:hypothetical protein